MNGPGFLSSGKIPNANGDEAPRVKSSCNVEI